MTKIASNILIHLVLGLYLDRSGHFVANAAPLPCVKDTCNPGCECPIDDCASDSYPWALHGWEWEYAESILDNYEIHKVGGSCENPPCLPLGKLLRYNPKKGLHGQIYFEADSARFLPASLPDGQEYDQLEVEIYGGVGSAETGSPCHEVGTLIDSDVLYWNQGVTPFDSYNTAFSSETGEVLHGTCYPQSLNGRVGSAEFSIDEPFLEGVQDSMKIWYPGEGDKDGLLKFCVRVVVQASLGWSVLEKVSYIDTMVTTSVDLSADFSTFTQDIEITHEASAAFESEISAEFDVYAFLCNSDGIEISNDFQFRSGQEFQICITPSGGFANDYKVSGLELVVCENLSTSRRLIQGGVSDLLTTIVNNVGNDESTMAFRSVVTADFFASGDSSFVCTGNVNLEPKTDSVFFDMIENDPEGFDTQVQFNLSIDKSLVHGFCFLNTRAEAVQTDTKLEYTNKGVLRYGASGISFVPPDSNENELTGIYDSTLCLGGSYWQSSMAVVEPELFDGIKLLASPSTEGMDFKLCMFLDGDISGGESQDGGLRPKLEAQGWVMADLMAGLGSNGNEVLSYCYHFGMGSYSLEDYSCRRLSTSKFSAGRIETRSDGLPRKLQEDDFDSIQDSPFATRIQLASYDDRLSAGAIPDHRCKWISMAIAATTIVSLWSVFM